MKDSGRYSAVAAAVGMLLLILDGKTALQGASEGVEICIKTLVPSLFPFFILSNVITNGLSARALPFLRPIGRLCHLPEGSEFLLAIGFLGGYPVGAQNVTQMYRRRILSKSDAERMVAFCNNAGPSFLFGIVAPLFTDIKTVWCIWLIHMLSAITVGAIIPGSGNDKVIIHEEHTASFTQLLQNSIRVMTTVCSWVILFRMTITFITRWILWTVPSAGQVLIAGILEIANGCLQLNQIPSEGVRFLLSSVLLSFGGICVSFQTMSVCDGLSLRDYFPGKLLQTVISAFISILTLGFIIPDEQIRVPAYLIILLLMTGLALIVYFRIPKKEVAFQPRLLYNDSN